MIKRTAANRTSLVAAMTALAVMAAISWAVSGGRPDGQAGLFLPSPNRWVFAGDWSWVINVVILCGVAAGSLLLNRRYNFIRSPQPVMPTMFLIMSGAMPSAVGYMSASTILAAMVLGGWFVAFDCYKARNATQEAFIIGTFLALGAMFQYAFLPFVITALVWLAIMNVFRIKEVLALLLGLVAPYWVVLGLGLLSLSDFNVPRFSVFSGVDVSGHDILVMSACAAVTAVIGLVAALNNEVKLFAGNSRILAMNNVVNVTGLTAAVCMIVDYDNFISYYSTLVLSVSVQIANIFVFWKMRRPWILTLALAALYVAFFIMALRMG